MKSVKAILRFLLSSIQVLGLLNGNWLMAEDTLTSKKSILSISGYMEIYYNYDLGDPADHLRPDFFYSFNRHNELNLNLGFAKVTWQTKKVRINAALMDGTYSRYNLKSEPGVLKNIFEANMGFKIRRNSNLWLDAGVMPSHIGFESAIGKDCWTLTRSILADNSPYFETGLRLGFTSKNEKLYLAALVLNGWQRIAWENGNKLPALGTQFTYKPDSARTFNWSTLLENEPRGNVSPVRFYNNLYGQFRLSARWSLVAGFDIGNQQKHDSTGHLGGWSVWYSPVVIGKFSFSARTSVSLRGEHYRDMDRVMIMGPVAFGFSTIGASANLDYRLRENVLWRIEGRVLQSPDPEYRKGRAYSRQNTALSTSLCVSF